MLAYILAIAVGLASFILFLAAFFRPKLHRQDDFLWSGIGLFYALFLWLCAQQLRGAVLLGQVAGTFLLLIFGWQTLKLRWAIAHPESIAEVENFSLLAWCQNRLGSLFRKKQPVIPVSKPAAETVATPSVEEVTQTTPEPPKEKISEAEEVSEPATSEPEPETVIQETITTAPIDENTEEITKKTTVSRITKPANPQKQGFSLKGMFGLGKQKPASKPESITTALNDFDKIGDEITDKDEIATEVETAQAYIVEQDKEIAIEVNRVKIENGEAIEEITQEIQQTIVAPEADEAKPKDEEMATEASPLTAPDSSVESEKIEDKPENT